MYIFIQYFKIIIKNHEKKIYLHIKNKYIKKKIKEK